MQRCAWASREPLIAYHDREWGVPRHDDATLFEFLVLEGAQAGLSWETVLRKRDRYREVFHGFDPQRVARITPRGVERIMQDPGVIRNRAKIESTVSNARAFLKVCEENGTFADFAWCFVGGETIENRWRQSSQLPVSTPESEAMSKELRRRGFRFVGPTICYSFMQAVGMVDDHLVTCFRHGRRNRA